MASKDAIPSLVSISHAGGRNRLMTITLTAITVIAFAANSVLCRLALAQTGIDPGSFTLVRIFSGAVTLTLLFTVRSRRLPTDGSWQGAAALFAYAAAFSFAYVSLPAATGALLLFGAVQATMILVGLLRGEVLTPGQWVGLALALLGLIALLAPGVSAPPVNGSVLMLGAGAAWGAYSLRGRRSNDPLGATAGNFVRATPMAFALALCVSTSVHPVFGLLYAALSGAIASGMGYAIWYAALPGLSAAQAASVQLSVPVITAFGGVFALGEGVSVRLMTASAAVLAGIALVIATRTACR
jgi:drug/metabolite transporter (DMT)-like permease